MDPTRPWPKISSRPLGDYRIFNIRADIKESPRTGERHEFYVLETVNWVNVVALTPLDEVVMIEQFRHGTNTVELEIPGGLIDATDLNPLEGGLRELREETGYEGESAEIIGQVYPNPAIMNNTCHTVLVKNCKLNHRVEFDHSEDIVTRLVPVQDICRLVAEGRIRHSLVAVALFHFVLWQQRPSSSKS
jgi:8-oxo-dGTP pyrophosphatase MutT (NUDIX family)